jgi:hypothetical protein
MQSGQFGGGTAPSRLKGNVINLRGKPFRKRVFPLNPRHRGLTRVGFLFPPFVNWSLHILDTVGGW